MSITYGSHEVRSAYLTDINRILLTVFTMFLDFDGNLFPFAPGAPLLASSYLNLQTSEKQCVII